MEKSAYLRFKMYIFFEEWCWSNGEMDNTLDLSNVTPLSEQVIRHLIAYDMLMEPDKADELKEYIKSINNESDRLKWLIKLIRHGKNCLRRKYMVVLTGYQDKIQKGIKYEGPADLNTSVPFPKTTFRKK